MKRTSAILTIPTLLHHSAAKPLRLLGYRLTFEAKLLVIFRSCCTIDLMSACRPYLSLCAVQLDVSVYPDGRNTPSDPSQVDNHRSYIEWAELHIRIYRQLCVEWEQNLDNLCRGIRDLALEPFQLLPSYLATYLNPHHTISLPRFPCRLSSKHLNPQRRIPLIEPSKFTLGAKQFWPPSMQMKAYALFRVFVFTLESFPRILYGLEYWKQHIAVSTSFISGIQITLSFACHRA